MCNVPKQWPCVSKTEFSPKNLRFRNLDSITTLSRTKFRFHVKLDYYIRFTLDITLDYYIRFTLGITLDYYIRLLKLDYHVIKSKLLTPKCFLRYV